MPRTRRQPSAARSSPSDAHLDHLTTEVLRLRLDQLKLATTGSRNTLLGRLRVALRERNNPATNQDTAPVTDQEPPIPRPNEQNEPSTVQSPPGCFTPDQLNTLKCLITSSIQDALPRLSAPSIAESPNEPQLPPPVNAISSPANPLSNHLPAKVIGSIKNCEYIDFNCLLPENVDGHDDRLRISFESSGGSGFTIPVSVPQQKRQKIDSIERWLTAFNIFASVVVHYFPYKASDLIAYQQTIRESQRKFAGMAWYAYDIAFRKQAANDKSISWAQRDTQLYLEKFTGLAKTACHMCGSADHFVNSCPIAPRRSFPPPPSQTNNACRNYNRKLPCATTPCPFKHRCNRLGCDGHHPAVEHDEKSTALDHSKRPRR